MTDKNDKIYLINCKSVQINDNFSFSKSKSIISQPKISTDLDVLTGTGFLFL